MAKEKSQPELAVQYIRESLGDIKANLAVIAEALKDARSAERVVARMTKAVSTASASMDAPAE